jgi:hypothetical protein
MSLRAASCGNDGAPSSAWNGHAFRLRPVAAAATIPRMRETPLRQEAWVLAVLLMALGQLACGSSGDTGPITSTLCTETFTACGGDPTGTWSVAGVCLDGDLAVAMNSQRSAACTTQTTGADVSATGSAIYTAMTASADAVVIYNETTTARSTESISPACATESFGVTTLDASGCTQIQTMLKNNDPEKTVACSLSAGNCNCRVTLVHKKNVQNLFTMTGSNIVEDTTYDICITGSTMLQKQTLAGTVSAVTRLTKH